MRAAVLAAIASLLLPTALARADAPAPPFSDVVFHGVRPPPAGAQAFTQVSHVIYLNPCLPDGCTVRPGFDDSRTDHSSIPFQQTVLGGFPYGSAAWDEVVSCVRDLYAPFDIEVTDQDPGDAPHFEVMIAGNASALGVPGAGGVAPFVPCGGFLQDNVITFVFAQDIANLDFLCWAAAQESGHVFGLDHELNAHDPMTYLAPPFRKPGFQNVDVECGEDRPRQCWCGGSTQNSYQQLMDTFGPRTLEPASLAITRPADGAWVKPGFTVRAEAMSQLTVRDASLRVDGTTTQTLAKPPLVFTAPTTLAGGARTIAVIATDAAERSLSTQITVNVTATCTTGAACEPGFGCLGGYCVPGAAIEGGLGAPCTEHDDCVTGTCGRDGQRNLCTATCDAGARCPAGFTCVIAVGGNPVCWPSANDGGCSSSRETAPALALFGLGALALCFRRRRRSAE
jgi:hypothetical protein